MDFEQLLPWHLKSWEKFTKYRLSNRLPHGLIINTCNGLGTKFFIFKIAQSLFCSHNQKNYFPCNRCRNCYLFARKMHPDFIYLTTKNGKQIRVSSIDRIKELVYKTAKLAEYKVVVINRASRMNVYATNSLLKTLEEPCMQTLIILVNEDLTHLPKTIVSRCQIIKISNPDNLIVTNWLKKYLKNRQIDFIDDELNLSLQLTNNAPFLAYDLLSNQSLKKRDKILRGLIKFLCERNSVNVVNEAEKIYANFDLIFFLDTIISFFYDILKYLILSCNQYLVNMHLIDQIILCSRCYKMEELFSIINYIYIQRDLYINNNLNGQLLIEQVISFLKEETDIKLVE